MSANRIMISPSGYDDVGKVLQRLGGQFADGRQLADRDMNNLRNFSFLADVKHFFLNCKSTLTAVAADPAACATIRRFVFEGGTLYASDWSSDVVAAAFTELVRFTPRAGKAGVVPAKVSDPYLARRLTGPIHLKFDLDAWVRISHFPPAADVYITDEERWSGSAALEDA